MRVLDWLPPFRMLPLRRTRRTWVGHGRVHTELRVVPTDRMGAFSQALERELHRHEGVLWAEANPHLRRIVVAYEPRLATVDELVALVDEVERDAGVDAYPYANDGPEHPADVEPLVRDFVALGVDVVGFGLGLVGQLRRFAPLPIEIDVAALVSVLEGAPKVRHVVERRMGSPAADLALAVANAVAQGLAQGPLGPVVDIAYRTSLYGELVSRRAVWHTREPDLCAKPSPQGLEPPAAGDRPQPLPAGPVERYADRAWLASLAGFGVGLLLTRRVERAVAALYAGLPKAARLGREAFAAQLGRTLGARGWLVLDQHALRRLDRVDCLVVTADALYADATLGAAPAPSSEELLITARRAGMRVIVAGPTAPRVDGVEHVADTGAALVAYVRSLQGSGHVVCVVGVAEEPALAAGDCSVGLVRSGFAPPWGADVIGGPDLAAALIIVAAAPTARVASEQSVMLATIGAGAGAFMAFGGLVPGTTHRATTSVNVAALMAMVNGTRHALDLARRPAPQPREITPWHELRAHDVLVRLGSTPSGLSSIDAEQRRVLPPAALPVPAAYARAVGEELANPLTPVLAVGALLSAATGSVTDAAMVSAVMGVNAVVGATQRFRTAQAVARLGRARRRIATVVRDGTEIDVQADEIVVGDVVRLRAGQIVPGDCRILSGHSLEVDESGLTGESATVTKSAAPSHAAAVAERTSMLYEGTSIAAGRGRAVVVAVPPETEARRSLALSAPPPETGVEARLRHLTALSIPMALGGGVGVLAAAVLRGGRMRDSIGAATSLAVAAVPEGLPLLATVAQLGAARRLSSRGALVRNPRAVEALGRVDVVCADKTGTLTEGRIALGRVSDGITHRDPHDLNDWLRSVLAVALRAGPDGSPESLPHPTDRALVEGAAAASVRRDEGTATWSALHDLPFEPARGYHAVLGDTGTGLRISVKGAPEVILPRCTSWLRSDGEHALDPRGRARLEHGVDELARLGMRVLAVAERDAEHDAHLGEERIDNLQFHGFVALSDPVRATTPDAITALRRAGVDVVMITGDHPSTARGIAVEIGLLERGSLLTGLELDALDDDALDEQLPSTTVFARVTPSHKVRIVQALQRAGRVVAMTGDGANDAPSIRLADVGIALGRHAAPAARDAADVIVTDERIETIVDAVIEGRAMWASVREAVAVLVGGNLGEIGFTVFGSLAGGRPPLNARQLLLVNLLTDAAPALALAMRRPPGATPERLAAEGPDRSLGRPLERAIAWRATMTAAGAFAAWVPARMTGTRARASTTALVALVGSQLGQTLAVGGRSPVVLAAGLGSFGALAVIVETPGLSHLFGCRPLGPVGWTTALTSATAATAAAIVVPRLADGISAHLPRRVNIPPTATPSTAPR